MDDNEGRADSYQQTPRVFSPKRLGFLSHTLGTVVPNAWDYCLIRVGRGVLILIILNSGGGVIFFLLLGEGVRGIFLENLAVFLEKCAKMNMG